ncbi:hypothetical protein V8D89_008618 [Ganoderma adspersum]
MPAFRPEHASACCNSGCKCFVSLPLLRATARGRWTMVAGCSGWEPRIRHIESRQRARRERWRPSEVHQVSTRGWQSGSQPAPPGSTHARSARRRRRSLRASLAVPSHEQMGWIGSRIVEWRPARLSAPPISRRRSRGRSSPPVSHSPPAAHLPSQAYLRPGLLTRSPSSSGGDDGCLFAPRCRTLLPRGGARSSCAHRRTWVPSLPAVRVQTQFEPVASL